MIRHTRELFTPDPVPPMVLSCFNAALVSTATGVVFATRCHAMQVSREDNTGSAPWGYDWSVSFLTDVEPSATSSRLVVSYNGVSGTGTVSAQVSVTINVARNTFSCPMLVRPMTMVPLGLIATGCCTAVFVW